MFKLHSGRLQLAAITQHLVFEWPEDTEIRVALPKLSGIFKSCLFLLWSDMNSATHKDRGRKKKHMTRRRMEDSAARWKWNYLWSRGTNRALPLLPGLNSLRFGSVATVHSSPRVSHQTNFVCKQTFFRCSFATKKNAAEKEAFFPVTNHTGSIQFKL